MLNFRKLKQDYSPSILKEGRMLYDKEMVISGKIVHINPRSIRMSCRVMGNFENTYQCEIEVDRNQSTAIDSDCDCSYKYDCQHLSAILFYLEENFDKILVEYSKETDIEKSKVLDLSLIHICAQRSKKQKLKRSRAKERKIKKNYCKSMWEPRNYLDSPHTFLLMMN